MKLAWIIIQGALAALIAMSGTANAATGDIVGENGISTVSSGTNFDNGDTALTPAGDGVATWRQVPDGGSTTSVFAATYSPVSGWNEPFRVSPANGVDVTRPSVATAANGDFVVAWTDQGGVHFQRYNADGSTEGDVRTPSTAVDAAPASVAADVDGNFAIAWITSKEVKAERFNADGTSESGVKTVSTSGGTASSAQVSLGATGQLALAWAQDGSAVYAATDISGTSQFDVATGLTNQPAVALSSAANGDFVVAWDMAGSDDNEIHAERFNKDGNSLEDGNGPFRVSPANGNTFNNPAAAMAARGDFFVAYEETVSGTPTTGVRYFDATGAPVTTVPGHGDAPPDQMSPAIAADADGDALVSSLATDGTDDVVFASNLEAPIEVEMDKAFSPNDSRTNSGASYVVTMTIANSAETPNDTTGVAAIDDHLLSATGVELVISFDSAGFDWEGTTPDGWICSEIQIDGQTRIECRADSAFQTLTSDNVTFELIAGTPGAEYTIRSEVDSDQRLNDNSSNTDALIVRVNAKTSEIDSGGGSAGWGLLLAGLLLVRRRAAGR